MDVDTMRKRLLGPFKLIGHQNGFACGLSGQKMQMRQHASLAGPPSLSRMIWVYVWMVLMMIIPFWLVFQMLRWLDSHINVPLEEEQNITLTKLTYF